MADDRPTAAAADLRELLPVSPDAYPQKVDLASERVLVIRMDARAYRAASFLDDRVLGPGTQGGWFSGAAVAEAARRVRVERPLHFIFHAGHVGSTLVSRLLDETAAVLPLREPLPLRAIAEAADVLGLPESLLSESQFQALLDLCLRLWRRGYDATHAVILKATSTAARHGGRLLDASQQSRAIYLNLAAEPYLATLLGGADSAIDMRGHAPGRMRRLVARYGHPVAPLHALSIGELAALGWLVESLTARDLLESFPGRVLALDFDGFLADVEDGLGRVLRHFGLAGNEQLLARISASPVLRQYSKAPELPFPAGERVARLAESRRINRDEIAKGLAWLEKLARQDDSVATLLAGRAA